MREWNAGRADCWQKMRNDSAVGSARLIARSRARLHCSVRNAMLAPFARPVHFGLPARDEICDQRGIEIARVIPFNCSVRLCCRASGRKLAECKEAHGRTRTCVRKGPSDIPGGTAWLRSRSATCERRSAAIEVIHGVDDPDRGRRVRRAGRPLRLRQVDPAADDRGAGKHHLRRDPHRRARRQQCAAERARHRHGVPELRALSAHDGRRQYGRSR